VNALNVRMLCLVQALALVVLCLVMGASSAVGFDAIELDGAWQFRAGDDETFAEPDFDDRGWDAHGVSAPWKEGGYPETDQMAWYRRTIEIPADARPTQWGIRVVAVRNAYEMYVDGERLGGVGSLPPAASINYDRQRVFLVPEHMVADGSLVVALRVWGGSDLAVASTDGGPRTSGFLLGDYTGLVQAMDAEQVPVLIFAALFCALGVYFTYLGARNRQLSGYWWFGLSAIDVGLWLLTQTQTKYFLDLPFIVFEKWETVVAYAMAPLFIQLFWTLAEAPFHWLVRLWQASYVAAALSIVVYPGLDLFYIMRPIWQVSVIVGWIPTFWMVFRQRARGSEGAKKLSLGLLAIFVFGTHDLLINLAIIDSTQLMPLGFLVLLGSIGVTLVEQFTRLRTSLEAQVRERTEALRDANERLSETNTQLEQMAWEDPLTGLLNRRGFELRAEAPWQRMRRSGRPFSILLADIDHFKSINDRFGHDEGDRMLVSVSRQLQQTTRAVDLVARWGGEEFVVLLEDAALPGAEIAAEQMRKTLEEMPFTVDSEPVTVTLTIGVAECKAGESMEAFIRRADQALYAGKQAGRNRVVCARS
jgi:diguanylate cyclase (GGDEF)-like protein